MDWLWFILIGFASGIFAGMGMGGGTLLIPFLTILMTVGQTDAQGINLVVFVPMAIVVGFIYSKSHLVDWKKAWIVAVAAVAVTIPASLWAVNISGEILKIIFGVFVTTIGVFQFISVVVNMSKSKKKI